jgi:hypothetical protein
VFWRLWSGGTTPGFGASFPCVCFFLSPFFLKSVAALWGGDVVDNPLSPFSHVSSLAQFRRRCLSHPSTQSGVFF